jgi:DNA-binding MarR family transcriptional regulator
LLTIQFSAEDLGRVTLASEPDVAWEMLLSLHALAGPPDHVAFGPWRTQALDQVLDSSTGLLLALAPPRGYSPDFLTPSTGGDLDAVADAVMGTSRHQLRRQIALLSGRRAPTPWRRALAHGDLATLKRLGTAMRQYHGKVLAPPWNHIRSVIEAERAARVRDFFEGGVERLLSNLHPTIHWKPPMLRVSYPVNQELRLDGRGLRLIPSYFCWALPITLLDDRLTPVLVYPANRALHRIVLHSPQPARTPLSRLLGQTRAAVLEEIATNSGLTGGRIAGRLRMSPASASEHTTTLRQAGLILSRRVGNTVWHTVTPLGRDLLDGCRSLP